MESLRFTMLSLLSILLFSITIITTTAAFSSSNYSSIHEDFLQCLDLKNNPNIKPRLYSPQTASYASVLLSAIQNLRFTSPSTPKPQFILTPSQESQVQAALLCAKEAGLQIRVRSGGHDFEGLSYTADVPFIIIDLVNLRAVTVDITNNSATAWVQGGATLGELYYGIAAKSPVYGFTAGICPTVGAGGHISGAGYGRMTRKYGVAADHVVDVRLINAKGQILDRKTMGEDLFWAIRGGGAASFGVILAYKIELVPVPSVVTTSFIFKTLEQNATELVYKWQTVASNKVPKELYIALRVTLVNSTTPGKGKTVQVSFQIMFLGHADRLLQLMQQNFPELGMKKEDCREVSWIESVVSFAGFPTGTPKEILLNRTIPFYKATFKGKSDFVKKPLPKAAIEGIWKRFLAEETPEMLIAPWGGVMNEVQEHKIAFPHRAGNLYLINYNTYWNPNDQKEVKEKHLRWISELYRYMGPYVSKNPRTAFLNYRDLDLGHNKFNGTTTYSHAKQWGRKYFKRNFEKLVQVKSKVDPDDFFRYEQSIPSLHHLKHY